MNAKTAALASLTATRLIKAPINRVFAAWTTPSDLIQWFGPGEWQVSSASLDLRPGGAYRIQFRLTAEKKEVTVVGVYREVTAPTRLVFTWKSVGNPQMDFGETLVVVDFLEINGTTEVRIVHEGFPAEQIMEQHNEGWVNCFDNLERLMANRGGQMS